MRHIGDEMRSGWGTLLKPVAWQGGLCFGPQVGTHVTFMRPDQAAPRWAGIPDPEVAGTIAVTAYVRTYGPATVAGFRRWMGASHKGARDILKRMGDRLAPVGDGSAP